MNIEYQDTKLTIFYILRIRRNLQIFCRPQRCLEPVGNIYFTVNIINMGLDGVRTDSKTNGNLIVGNPGSQQQEYLGFPGG